MVCFPKSLIAYELISIIKSTNPKKEADEK